MDERVMNLEVKVSFLEKTVADLDDVVRETRDLMERMHLELKQLREAVKDGDSNEAFDPDAEVPPHY